jgi:hypothetical protein
MKTFDVYFFLLAWGSGLVFAFCTMLGAKHNGPGKLELKRRSKSGKV